MWVKALFPISGVLHVDRGVLIKIQSTDLSVTLA